MNEDEGERLAWEARQKMSVRQAAGFSRVESAPLPPDLCEPLTVKGSPTHLFVLNAQREIVAMVPRARTLELPLTSLRTPAETAQIGRFILAAPHTARRLSRLEAAAREAIFFLSADRGAASEAGEAVSEMVVEQVEKALRAALEETDAD